jgi:hypothetical protein
MRTASLTIDSIGLCNDGFRDVTASTDRAGTDINSLRSEVVRIGDTVQSISERLAERSSSNMPPTADQVSTLNSLVLATESSTSCMPSQQHHDRGHELQDADRTLISVQTTLSSARRCNPSCMCQCHKGSQTGTPGLLSNVLGRLLIWYNGIPYWRPRTCNHPKCQRKSPTQVRLNYLFPRWMLQKGIHVCLSWGSVTGSGASLYLSVPRIIPDTHRAWSATDSNNLSWLQTMVRAENIFPTDVDPRGLSLLMVSLVIVGRYCPCLTSFVLACHVMEIMGCGVVPLDGVSYLGVVLAG